MVLLLNNNDIDDEGVGMIVQALSHENKLKELSLGTNQSITIRGWKRVATLLEMPDCSLENLCIYHNYIGDEGALVFANALKNNSTLKVLRLNVEGSITAEGWTPFLKLLCDTSTVNNTYLSNHTLGTISDMPRQYKDLLDWNRYYLNKQQVAMLKIFRNHSHFNVESFFEWEFKVLPIMIEWFEKAATRLNVTFMKKINKMKLSVIHDFVKEFPMLYIESVTRKEIAKCTSLEEEFQGDELEQILQLKARALRRL